MEASFDYIVCGSGAAGGVIAARLHEGEPALRILLLEAGPDHASRDKPAHMAALNPFDMWDDKRFKWPNLKIQRTAAQEPRAYPAGRCTGGGSAINGMGAIRGEQEDYDGWSRQGCEGWDWDSVLPFFRALEDDPCAQDNPEAHGRGGPIPIYRPPVSEWGAVGKATMRAALALGHGYEHDLNRPGGTGASPFPINCKPAAGDGELIRWSVNDGYIEPLRAATCQQVEIRAGHHVEKILLDGRRAVGVQLLEVATGRVSQELAAVEVLVCCGAVQSPALLQRSGIGPSEVLRPLGIPVVHDVKAVGANMQDHPTIGCQLQLKTPPSPTERHANMLVRFSSNMGGKGLIDRSDGAPPPGLNDLYFCTAENGRLVSTPTEDAAAAAAVEKSEEEAVAAELHAEEERRREESRGFIAVMLLQCYSRGQVQITSTEPLAMPDVRENMLSDSGDLARMRFGVRKLAELVLEPAILNITETADESSLLMGNDWGGEKLSPSAVLAMSDVELDTWMVLNAGDGIHTTGTCRMVPVVPWLTGRPTQRCRSRLLRDRARGAEGCGRLNHARHCAGKYTPQQYCDWGECSAKTLDPEAEGGVG